jgi:hypothetical protein
MYESNEKLYRVSRNGGDSKEVYAYVDSTFELEYPSTNSGSVGAYSYFTKGKNSTNQIWRKKGNVETQMTHDLDHAWNPYLSPDGKYSAYLSMSNMSNPAKLMGYQKAAIKVLPKMVEQQKR